MSQIHRHLDHAWRRMRDHINYSLFGNTHGEMVTVPNHNWGHTPWTTETLRAERWRIKYICKNVSSHSKREESLAWLRYKELEV